MATFLDVHYLDFTSLMKYQHINIEIQYNTPFLKCCFDQHMYCAHIYNMRLFFSPKASFLEAVEYHIYLYCFTFDDINLKRAFVIIVLFPKNIAIRKCVQMI